MLTVSVLYVCANGTCLRAQMGVCRVSRFLVGIGIQFSNTE